MISPIEINRVDYITEYRLRLYFSDGKVQDVDFKNFINHSTNPQIAKYKNLDLFKSFQLTYGDLEWNDFDLCFPIADLYENNIDKSTQHNRAA